MELMSTSYSDSDSTGTVRNGVTHKVYAIFASQPTRRFLLALSITQQEFCVHMFDRAGVMHSRAYSIHRSPHVLLCMLAVLTFGQPEHVGFNPTIIYSSPTSQISSNNTIQVGSATYSIIRQIFFNYLICGRGMTCWHVCRNGEDFVIKDSWTHESQINREADILSKICGLKGVPQLVTAWTVQIEGSDDRTDARRAFTPSSIRIHVHRRLLMQPVGLPLSEFKSLRELLSIFIDILDSMSKLLLHFSLADLTTFIAHKALVQEFHVLHCDVSVNNIMIYNCDVPASETSDSHGEEVTQSNDPDSGEGEESLKEKLVQWDQERHKQIQAGILRNGLLIDFDYATDLEQNLPTVCGDCTVSVHIIYAPLTH